MTAWMVYATFKDGSIEGAVFSDKQDALTAFKGYKSGEPYSTMAGDFYDAYGEDSNLAMREIELGF